MKIDPAAAIRCQLQLFRDPPGLYLHIGEVALLLKPLAPVGGALLRKQHVHQLLGLIVPLHGELHQTAGARIDGRLAQLRRVHLAEALEAGHSGPGARVVLLDTLQELVALHVIERVVHLFAGIDPVERRHGHVDVSVGHQRTEVTQEQRAQQRRDVLPIRVGIREDTDLVVAQLTQVVRARIDTERHADVVYLLRRSDLPGLELPGVQDLAAQRHDGLEVLVARLLGGAPGRVTLHQEQLGAARILARAIGELPGQRRPACDALAHDPLRGLGALLGVGDGELCDPLARIRMAVEPQRHRVAYEGFHQSGGIARGQPLLQMLDDIENGSVRLIKIVNDFLNVSRFEQGRITMKIESFAPSEVIEETIKGVKELAAEKKLNLESEGVSAALPHVRADRDRVKEVLLNLIGNAINYTSEGGIKVKAEQQERFIKIYVSDTGVGIPLEYQSLLFHKFQQAGPNILTRSVAHSTGLGLYISKLMVEAMGGTIKLERSVPKGGTTFSFTLPIAD